MFVKFSEILIDDQKLPELLAHQFKLDFKPSFMFAQAIQNEASAGWG